MFVATASTGKKSSFSHVQDFDTTAHAPTPDPGLMPVATVSTYKAFWFFAAPWLMLVATVSTCKASQVSQLFDLCLWPLSALGTRSVFSQVQDFATPAHVPTPDARLMLIATISTCIAFSFQQIHDWCLWRQWTLVKHVFATVSNGKASSFSPLLPPLLLLLVLMLHVNRPVACCDSQHL